MVVEGIGTFFLVWVIFGVAVNPRAAKDWAALRDRRRARHGRDGASAPLTGAGFNPARAFGPAIVSGDFGGADNFLLVYVARAGDRRARGRASRYFNLVIAPGKRGVGGVEPVG